MNKDILIPRKCIFCNSTQDLIEIEIDDMGCHCFVCQSCFEKHDQQEIVENWFSIWDAVKLSLCFDYDMVIDLTNDVLKMNYTTSDLVDKSYSRSTTLSSSIMAQLASIIERYNHETPNYKLSLTIRCYESSVDSKIINKIENYLNANVRNFEQWFDIKNSEQLVD